MERADRVQRAEVTRPTAASLILHFLRHVGTARLDRISRYMDSQWNTPASTTRNTLSRLCIAGRVARVGRARYQWVDVTPAELNTKPAPLTTTLG